MKKPISSGFLIRSGDLFLLCHTTQDPGYIDQKEDRNWSIPKGLVEKDEDILSTAIREVEEETGIDLTKFASIDQSQLIYLFESKHKFYYVYFFDDDTGELLSHPLYCKSIIDNEYVPRRMGLPEHDDFKWVTKEESKLMVIKSLEAMFELNL